MTFSRIKTVGWQVNEKVTSAQLNQLDLDHFKSLDKTGDNLSNGGGITGRVDVISGGTLEVQSGGAINIHTGGQIYLTGGGVTVNSGDMVFNNSTGIDFNDSSFMTFTGAGTFILGSSASELCAGTLNITSGGTLGINSGATQHVKSGGSIIVDNGGQVSLSAGGAINVASGGNINVNVGGYLNATNATTTFNGNLVILEGGVTVITSGSAFLTMDTGSTTNIKGTFKVNDFASFNTPLARAVIESTTSGIAASGTWAGGLQFVYDTGTGGTWVQQLQRSHHGARLNQIFVSLSVGTGHASVPAVRPSLSILRYRWDNMFSAQALSTTDPQYFPNPGSGSAYYNSGNQQFMNYVCNQNNIIDNENYIYVLVINDESGAGSAANNAYGLIYLDYQSIPSTKWNT